MKKMMWWKIRWKIRDKEAEIPLKIITDLIHTRKKQNRKVGIWAEAMGTKKSEIIAALDFTA